MARTANYWLILVILPLVGWGAQSSPSAGEREAVSGDYVLKPQDLIRIQIFQEPDLNRELRISQESSVALPLIGTMELKDKTVRQAEELIRKLYDADFLVNPQVNITVVEYAPRTMEVFGAVTNPGVIVFPREEQLTLTGAISRAGSFSRLANKKAVTLKRTLPDGKIQTWIVNVDELTKGETNNTWPLQPGDVVTVPERIL
ncbi:MAG: hypothetical protein RIQ93_1017 [Verrucomicrobiota bacterium]